MHNGIWLLAFAAACGTDFSESFHDGGINADSGGTADGDLPCAIATSLESHCTECHGDPPRDAPMSLVTYADLVAPSPLGGTIAHRAYLRMTSTTMPMPPGGGVPAAEIAAFKAWVDAGTKVGMPCTTPSPPDPLDAAPICTNGTFSSGDGGSPLMHPGRACQECHAQQQAAPRFTISGTVFPTGHEPDECNGTSDAQIVITDHNGQTITLAPNAAGNFTSSVTVAYPIRARVITGGRERVMATPQPSADCNLCHTQDGTSGAPGRVTIP